MLAQKERGLELSEQFDEKILQVLTRVSHSALEISPVCMGTCSSQLVCNAQNNFEASPPPRATPGNFTVVRTVTPSCSTCRVARRAALAPFPLHECLWDRVVSRSYRGGGKFEACLGGVGNLNC